MRPVGTWKRHLELGPRLRQDGNATPAPPATIPQTDKVRFGRLLFFASFPSQKTIFFDPCADQTLILARPSKTVPKPAVVLSGIVLYACLACV